MRRRSPKTTTSAGPCAVVFETEGRPPVALEADPGTTLLAAASKGGVDMSHYCGGYCSCGTCRVEVIEGAQNLSPAAGNEQMVLGSQHHGQGHRLGCQARILGPVHIRIPDFF